jgi:DNA-binding transcriptional ArsR family regulator
MVDHDLDRVFRGLSDPTRRAILARLSRAPARVSDLAAGRPMSLQAVSKHVAVLEEAGLLVRRRAGRDVWCEAAPAALAAAEAWIADTRRFWTARLDELAAAAEDPEEGT